MTVVLHSYTNFSAKVNKKAESAKLSCAFNLKPAAFLTKPAAFPAKPAAFPAKPAAFPTKPASF